jgi:hypothetical protein
MTVKTGNDVTLRFCHIQYYHIPPTTMLARITVARRMPRAFVAHYSVRAEGSVAQSKTFNKKEKAHEDEYIHRQEMDKLNKLQKQIEKKKKELDDLEKVRADLENGAGKQ